MIYTQHTRCIKDRLSFIKLRLHLIFLKWIYLINWIKTENPKFNPREILSS